jgi:hypothetical protein
VPSAYIGWDVGISGNYAYYTDCDSGFVQIVNISDPVIASIVNTLSIGGYGINVNGNKACVAGDDRVSILDLSSDPVNPPVLTVSTHNEELKLMKKRPLLLRALEFSPFELETLLTCAVKVMHVDNRLRLEEESIINLIPQLLRIAKEDAPEQLKSEWRKKLIIASYALKKNPKNFENERKNIIESFPDYTKRATCLIILFLIMACDKHIDSREIDFIINDIAKPWNFSIDELIDLMEEDSERLFMPESIIKVLKEYKKH